MIADSNPAPSDRACSGHSPRDDTLAGSINPPNNPGRALYTALICKEGNQGSTGPGCLPWVTRQKGAIVISSAAWNRSPGARPSTPLPFIH